MIAQLVMRVVPGLAPAYKMRDSNFSDYFLTSKRMVRINQLPPHRIFDLLQRRWIFDGGQISRIARFAQGLNHPPQ